MAPSEMEVELAALRREVAALQARDEARARQLRPLAKATRILAVLFALAALFLVGLSVWSGRSDVMQFMYPMLFTGISMSFMSSAFGAWRSAEARAN
jgi:hypothetical protein